LFTGLLVCLCIFGSQCFQTTPQHFTIGVLAIRGVDDTIAQWAATAEYLQDVSAQFFGVAHTFSIAALGWDDLDKAVGEGIVDFVITNPSHYMQMEIKHSLSRVATLVNLRQGHALTQFGGVIMTMEENNITTLEHLQSATIHAVSPDGLGAYQMQIGYLLDNGVDVDALNITFVYNQNLIAKNVLDGVADVGFVRTDLLERFVASNPDYLPAYGRVSVFNSQNLDGFPFPHTTRLYPEWPFAASQSAEDDIDIRIVIAALFDIKSNSTAAISGKYEKWTYPLNYREVFSLLDQLGTFDNDEERCLKSCNQENGVCRSIENTSVCMCSIGWEGENCDVIGAKIERWVKFDRAGVFIVVFIAVLVIVTIITLLILVIIIRETKMIKKKAGFWFSVLSLAGFVLMVSSIFFWIGKPTATTCALRIWVISIGFMLAYIGPLVKIWRLSVLFNNQTLKVFAIRDGLLAKIVLGFTLVEVVFLILWQVIAPPVPLSKQVSERFDTIDDVCDINKYFGFISAATKMALLIAFGWLAFTVRKVASDFKSVDQKYVNLSIYNSMVFSLLFASLLIGIPNKQYLQEFYIVAAGVLTLTITAVTPLMIPTLILSRHYTGTTGSTRPATRNSSTL